MSNKQSQVGRQKLHIRRNDLVAVISGDSKGDERRRVLRVMPRENKVVVEGVNVVWKHVRRSQQHPHGGRIERESPIDASKVMLVCPNRECKRHDKPVRVRRVPAADGGKTRVCTKCGEPIPTPA